MRCAAPRLSLGVAFACALVTGGCQGRATGPLLEDRAAVLGHLDGLARLHSVDVARQVLAQLANPGLCSQCASDCSTFG